MNICCVFVSNKRYFNQFKSTCLQLINNGKYKGPICLVIGNDLKYDELLDDVIIQDNNIIIKYFPDIVFPEEFFETNNTIKSDGRNKTKKFQWHKLHLFNEYFKKWDYIFYIDCGMFIFDDISPMLHTIKKNTLLAHSDSFPTYTRLLKGQFDNTCSKHFTKLSEKYNLNIDYFQSTIMLYSTEIIEKETYNDLLKLSIEYPISNTNEQGIMSLYFICIKNIWNQIQLKNEHTNFYDFWCRNKNDTKYIMVKKINYNLFYNY